MTGLTVYYTVTSVSKLYVQCSAVVLTISLIPILIHTCRLVGGAAKVLSASQEPRSLFSNLILNKSHWGRRKKFSESQKYSWRENDVFSATFKIPLFCSLSLSVIVRFIRECMNVHAFSISNIHSNRILAFTCWSGEDCKEPWYTERRATTVSRELLLTTTQIVARFLMIYRAKIEYEKDNL